MQLSYLIINLFSSIHHILIPSICLLDHSIKCLSTDDPHRLFVHFVSYIYVLLHSDYRPLIYSTVASEIYFGLFSTRNCLPRGRVFATLHETLPLHASYKIWPTDILHCAAEYSCEAESQTTHVPHYVTDPHIFGRATGGRDASIFPRAWE